LKKTKEALAELEKAEKKAREQCEALQDERDAMKRDHKAKMDAEVAVYVDQLKSLRQTYNEELQNGDTMKVQMEEMEVHHVAHVRMYKVSTAVAVLVAASALSVATGVVDPAQVQAQIKSHALVALEIARDSMCAPVPPGFAMPDATGTFDAPWWAPRGAEEQCFQVCGDRTRSRMHWDWINNKLSTYTLGKEGKATRIWTMRVPDAKVSGDKILIKSWDGKVQRVLTAPWAA
jgi:hypothetical protein